MFTERAATSAGEPAIACLLCPHRCVLREGATGRCGVRGVEGGSLVSRNYAMVTGACIDPIEKKPLYHFMPGSEILSVGTFGCNMGCEFCQNWEISQARSGGTRLAPAHLVALAQKHRDRSIGVAYTYSEPTVWYEYVLESARLVRAAGLRNVLVTNGFINPDPLAELLPFVDAMNIDLKSMDEAFYWKVCGASPQPVLEAIERSFAAGCHVELTTLVIPGLNDGIEHIDRLAAWAGGLSRGIPLHLSRYFPNYKMDIAPTPIETLAACADAARAHLDYVFVGNAVVPGGNDTSCPNCGELLIERRGLGFAAPPIVHMAEPRCPACGVDVPVVLG